MRYKFHFNQDGQILVAANSYTLDMSTAGWVQWFGTMDSTGSISNHHQFHWMAVNNITSYSNGFGFNGARTSNETGPGDQWIYLRNSSVDYWAGSGADGPRDNTEYFYEVRWTGSAYTAYRNGSQIITSTNYSNGRNMGDQSLTFASFQGFSSGTLKGYVRDFRIYSGSYPSGTLLHYWPIDENVSTGGTIKDIVGNANGTLTSGTGSWSQFSQPYSYGQILMPGLK